MAFSAKTEYGLVALIDLADAHGTGVLLQTGDICRRHGIPTRYLEQMLTALRKGGFLKGIRGLRGGFRLALPPEDVTIAAVELNCAWKAKAATKQSVTAMIQSFRR